MDDILRQGKFGGKTEENIYVDVLSESSSFNSHAMKADLLLVPFGSKRETMKTNRTDFTWLPLCHNRIAGGLVL